ncbi:ComF family protein [Variovorax ginsengisoli]|uniref:ComF family protein n=1 Tax=Variovorax ginsengisoli TaxID=363844 RepID=A0ABT8S0Y7_9BURK|nr:ComF family protein [Variovorax ginsengisoli]MDN8613293.1 ComF family protein [Variovorax ginsengisoli]MDO1532463.1 ComF family protein [Variovorax ginsengisoli]
MFKPWAARPFSALAARLPGQCAVCRAWPAASICEACVARFAAPVARCPTCALPLGPGDTRCRDCQRQPPPLDACLAACAYAWPWPECISAFKFHGDAGRAAPLATLMRSAPWVEPALEQADTVLPMPLAPARLRERGFNQAYELARRLAPDKCDPRLLLRTRDTAPQSGLARQDRLHNLSDAFALDPRRPGAVHGRRLVLVDDVMTSGASLYAAAEVLRAAGAARITAIVLARTDAPD